MSDYNEPVQDDVDGDADELVYQSGECGRAAHCPLKRLGGNDVAAGIATAAIMAVTVAVSVYMQYALTKWAVKSALKETRLR